MAIQPKIRPSLSIKQASLIHDAIKSELAKLFAAGDFNNANMPDLMELGKYFNSLLGDQFNGQQLAVQRAYQANGIVSPESKPSSDIPQESINIPTNMDDMLNDPNISDEQKYDIICMQPTNTFTAKQEEFYNRVGFRIKMERAIKAQAKSNISEDNL